MCSENKGADQLCGYCTTDLAFVFAYAKILFSHDEAQMAGCKRRMLKRRKFKEEKKRKREEKMGIKNFFNFISPCRRRSHVFDQTK